MEIEARRCMEDIRDPQQRREMIERLRRESAELIADMARRREEEFLNPEAEFLRRRAAKQRDVPEPEPSPPVRETQSTGVIYRDYRPDSTGEAGAGEDAPLLDTDPQAAAEQSAQRDADWAQWFRERFADELIHGAGGEAIIHLVLAHVEPLSREISELRGQVRALTDIITKSARRSRRR
jgi:hypothetical protein